MKTLTLIFLALSVASAHASTKKEHCFSNVTHTVREGAPIPEGWFKGVCINTELAMPVSILAQAGDTLTLANVMSGGKHGTLVFHRSDLEKTIFQIERFDPKLLAAHTQIRLKFKPNSLQWYKDSTTPSQANSSPDRVFSDLVLSIEAIGKENYHYGIIKGQLNFFALVYRAVDLQDKVHSMITVEHNTVDQWTLALNQNQGLEYLDQFLARSQKNGLKVMYNTLFKNCTNELFRTLNSIRDRPAPFDSGDLRRAVLPVWSPDVLRERGYISGEPTDLGKELQLP